jgi:hypothetical protein
MLIRILRALGFGVVGAFILSAMFMGTDTMLSKTQFFLAIGGAGLAVVTLHFVQWRKSASPINRFAAFSFFGALLGTVIATLMFGGWSVLDNVAAGLGAGAFNGILITLGAAALRSAALSFSK